MDTPTTALVMQLIHAAKPYVTAVLMPPAKTAGDLLAKALKNRLDNTNKVIRKSAKLCRQRKIKVKQVPQTAIPVLHESAKADATVLQDMFAELLTSHLDAKSQHKVHPSFAGVLGQMTSLDARLFSELARRFTSKSALVESPPFESQLTAIRDCSIELGCTVGDAAVSIDNLVRLGLLRSAWRSIPENMSEKQWISLSNFGAEFLLYCRPHLKPSTTRKRAARRT